MGTAYKQEGEQAALALGHQLVSGAVRESRIEAWCDFVAQHPDAYLACWRGGARSAIVQTWLAARSVDIPRVPGGYKALRRRCIEVLDQAPLERKTWIVLGGRTGTAKTVLIRVLDNAIDLEGAANHRGSAFGSRPEGQPALATFENTLAVKYLEYRRTHRHQPLILEDESRTIGRLALPESWHRHMQICPVVLIEAGLEERVAHIRQEYIHDVCLPHDQLQRHYQAALQRIARRLGGARYQQLQKLLADAFEGSGSHESWISTLLTEYYDPMYDYQLKHKNHRIRFRGDFATVRQYLESMAAPDARPSQSVGRDPIS